MVPVKEIIKTAESAYRSCNRGFMADTSIGLRFVIKFCGDYEVLSHREVNKLACQLDDLDDWIAQVISGRLIDLCSQFDSFKTYSA